MLGISMIGECPATGINIYHFSVYHFCDNCPFYDKNGCNYDHTDIKNRREIVFKHQDKVFDEFIKQWNKRNK